MMEYMIIFACLILAFLLCSLAYIIIDKLKTVESTCISNTDSPELCEDEIVSYKYGTISDTTVKIKFDLLGFYKHLSVIHWVVIFASVVLVGITAFFAQSYNLEKFAVIKLLCCTGFVMFAAVIDLFIKKIPNKLTMLIFFFGLLSLVYELLFFRTKFKLYLISSLIGLIASFLVLFIMSILTKGGLGMGDVKLISAVGFVMGIANVIYSFTYALIICLVFSVILILTHTKKMKDEIPFGPFYFIGFVISICLGTF